jgi:hypothetical protein
MPVGGWRTRNALQPAGVAYPLRLSFFAKGPSCSSRFLFPPNSLAGDAPVTHCNRPGGLPLRLSFFAKGGRLQELSHPPKLWPFRRHGKERQIAAGVQVELDHCTQSSLQQHFRAMD